MAPDAKSAKRKLLDDSDSDSESDNGGAPVAADSSFKVNEEYARRFEHNKKREERQRLEEKYKNDNGDDSSSSDETEDEEGFLATEDLDAQISATLQAIRTKDPRVYDSNVTFYQPESAEGEAAKKKEKKEKPVYLKDYHRERFMKGDIGASDDEDDEGKAPPPQTYAQEQDALQKSIIDQMHAAQADGSDSDSDGEDFMKRKKKPAAESDNEDEDMPDAGADAGVHPSRAAAVTKGAKDKKKRDKKNKKKGVELDVENADRDPETFLSNFMTARAWVPDDGTAAKWEAFESDDGDSEDNERAETFEQAYNLRFEDPERSNEVLRSYARDLAASKSVRREDKSSRKKRRDAEREKKEAEKAERRAEKARLRKLKLDEAHEKLAKIKQAAGSAGAKLSDEDWLRFLDDAWDDDSWEDEMKKRFGDDYYEAASEEDDADDDDEDSDKKKKKHPKKPTWDDDIDIKDIVPDFDDESAPPAVDLGSDAEAGEAGEDEEEAEEATRPSKKLKTADHKRARQEAQKEARRERAKLEALVDSKLELTHHDILASGKGGAGGFRYRETEPQSFGMTARDILLAPSDAHLNEYAGLKKLAPFRPAEKRQRDAQRLSKKKRLRQWRRDVFGKEFEKEGPTYGFEKFATEDEQAAADSGRGGKHHHHKSSKSGEDGNVVGEVGGSRKKRKRSKGSKAAAAEAEA